MPSDLSYLRERQRADWFGSPWASAAEYRAEYNLWGRIPFCFTMYPPPPHNEKSNCIFWFCLLEWKLRYDVVSTHSLEGVLP